MLKVFKISVSFWIEFNSLCRIDVDFPKVTFEINLPLWLTKLWLSRLELIVFFNTFFVGIFFSSFFFSGNLKEISFCQCKGFIKMFVLGSELLLFQYSCCWYNTTDIVDVCLNILEFSKKTLEDTWRQILQQKWVCTGESSRNRRE